MLITSAQPTHCVTQAPYSRPLHFMTFHSSCSPLPHSLNHRVPHTTLTSLPSALHQLPTRALTSNKPPHYFSHLILASTPCTPTTFRQFTFTTAALPWQMLPNNLHELAFLVTRHSHFTGLAGPLPHNQPSLSATKPPHR
jgi:hypothetical protein